MARQIPPKFQRRSLIEEIVLEGKLIFRLFLDRRVSLLLKLIPVAGILFVVNPVDFPSMIDDLLVLVFSIILFVELCPRPVVEELRQELRSVVTAEWHDAPGKGGIIDGELRDPDDKASVDEKREK